MAKILVIDSNPEQMRSLTGLIEHRTSHTMVGAETSLDGIRIVVSDRPDVILINALMYMHRSFSFHKAMQKSSRAAATPVLVHTSSPLEDLTRRRMEVNGVLAVIELPTSAGELESLVGQALAPPPTRAAPGTVASVSWDRVERPPQPVQQETSAGTQVSPVNWASIAASKPPPVGRPTRKEQPSVSERGARQRPKAPAASENGSDSSGGSGFRPQTYSQVDPSADSVKGAESRESFEEISYPKVNPKDVKNRQGK